MKRRTRELAILMDVKIKVAERDCVDGWPCCILCGEPAPTSNLLAFSNAHYIPRAQGGLGIEENILTLCPKCHREYDGIKRTKLRPILRKHLRDHYKNWDESKLFYQKRGEI